MGKPDLTKTSHILPFSELSPLQFERLCLWLVEREGYLRPEHLGEAGSEQGRDVIAYRKSDSREDLWYFQCKRYKIIGATTLIKEVEKYNHLVSADPTKRPVGIVFVTNAVLAAAAREKLRKFCSNHGYKAEFWARTELDMLVKNHEDIVAEFFNSPLLPQQPCPELSKPPGTRTRDPHLMYGYGVEFVGRDKELLELRTFVESTQPSLSADFAWWLWTAPGGQGKTRLAAQLCVELVRKGWDCGFLPTTSDFVDWKQWIVGRPTLIVIDHVARRAKKIKDAICAISRAPTNVRAPLRFLLLERPFSLQDQWLSEFVPEASEDDKADLFEYVYLSSSDGSYGDLEAITRRLEPLNEDDLWLLITRLAEERELSTSDRDSSFALLRKIDPLLRPLFVIFSLDAIAARGWDGIRKWNRDDLVRFIMKREFDLWRTRLLGSSEDPTKHDCFEQHINLVTFATIGGRQRKDLYQLLQKYEVPVPKKTRPDWLRVIAGYADELDSDLIAPVEPDLLGELFVLERLAGEFGTDSSNYFPKAVTTRILDVAFAVEHHRAIDFVRRCIEDFPDHPSIQTFPHIQIPEGGQANYGYYEDHTVHLGLVARTLEQAQRIDLVEECYDELVQLGHRFSSARVSDSDYKMRLGSALYNRALFRLKLDRLSEALSDCNDVIGLTDEYKQPRLIITEYQLADIFWRTLLLRARIHETAGDRDKAEEDVARILAANDVNMQAEALLFRAAMWSGSDDHQALSACEAILALSGENLEEVKTMAINKAIAVASGYYHHDDLGLEYFDRLVRMTEDLPDLNAMVRVDRGNIRLRRNDLREAEEDWSEVVRDRSAPADQRRKALINRGQLLLAQGALKWAMDDINAALEDAAVGTRDWASALLTRAQINHYRSNRDGALADISSVLSARSMDQDILDAAEQVHRRYFA